MRGKLRAIALACVAVGLVTACGGGDSSSTNGGGIVSPADSALLGSDCFATPGVSKSATVSASAIAPVASVAIATITGLGQQVFEGQPYAALDVRNRVDQVLNSDQHHALYLLPNAPYLPAGAITYPANGTGSQERYAYTYAAMTLEQLTAALRNGKATVGINGLVIQNLTPAVPTVADFKLNTPVTLLMLQKSASGTNALQAGFDTWSVKELTLAYTGRESVTVGNATYGNACKMAVSARRGSAYTPAQAVGQATLWFAPGVGLVKMSANNLLTAPLGNIDTTIVPAN